MQHLDVTVGLPLLARTVPDALADIHLMGPHAPLPLLVLLQVPRLLLVPLPLTALLLAPQQVPLKAPKVP